MGRKITEVKCHFITSFQEYLLSAWLLITLVVSFDHLADIVFFRFLCCKVTFFSPLSSYCPLWKAAILCHLLWRSEESGSTSFRVDYLLGILLHGRCFSFPFINLFNHLFICVWIHWYLFYTLVYNLILFYFFAQIIPNLAIGVFFR